MQRRRHTTRVQNCGFASRGTVTPNLLRVDVGVEDVLVTGVHSHSHRSHQVDDGFLHIAYVSIHANAADHPLLCVGIEKVDGCIVVCKKSKQSTRHA